MKNFFKLICATALGMMTLQVSSGQSKVVKYKAEDIKTGDYVAWSSTKNRYIAIDGGYRGDYERRAKIKLDELGKQAGFSDVAKDIVGIIMYVFPDGKKPGDPDWRARTLTARFPNSGPIPTDKDIDKKKGLLYNMTLSGIWSPDGKTMKHAYVMSLTESSKKMVYCDEDDDIFNSKKYSPDQTRIRDRIILKYDHLSGKEDERRGDHTPKQYLCYDVLSRELYYKPEPKERVQEYTYSMVGKNGRNYSGLYAKNIWRYSHSAYVYSSGYDLKQEVTKYNERRGASHRIKPNHWALECDKKTPLKGTTSGWFVPTVEEMACGSDDYIVNHSLEDLARVRKDVKPFKVNQNYWTIQEAADNKACAWYFDKNWILIDMYRKKNAEFWVRCVAVI